jgi:hypothetical protein
MTKSDTIDHRQVVSFTDEYFADLAKRNENRRQEAIEKLGDKWLLHPSNYVKNKNDSESRNNAEDVQSLGYIV